MPRYRYTDVWPRAFLGLSHGANATVIRADATAPADVPGATVELHPGDELVTTDPLEHTFLEPVPDAPASPTPAPAAPAADPAPAEETAP